MLNSTHLCSCKHAAVSRSALPDDGNKKETKEEKGGVCCMRGEESERERERGGGRGLSVCLNIATMLTWCICIKKKRGVKRFLSCNTAEVMTLIRCLFCVTDSVNMHKIVFAFVFFFFFV